MGQLEPTKTIALTDANTGDRDRVGEILNRHMKLEVESFEGTLVT